MREMAKFLLDTTAIIDFAKGREPAKSRILEMMGSEEEVGVCAINIAEFFTGLPVAKRREWVEFFDALAFWDITKEAAFQAGYFRYDFLRKGKSLTTADTLVAAVAKQEDAVIITNNVKDYPMKEVTLLQIDSTLAH